ncbi:MAG: hypothetical protein P8Y97_21230, partial [Candidatus Lokiarchaeota archaeon]
RNKIKGYHKKLKEIKFKEKLKNLVFRIGISIPDDIVLYDPQEKKVIYPCHLGICFYGQFKEAIFNNIQLSIEEIFPDFCFNIVDLGTFNFSLKMLLRGTKKEFEDFDSTKKKLNLHPTNKFYQILINKRIEHKLDTIIAITDLPLYSSVNNKIHFLFGEANMKYGVGVVSSLKLKQEFYNKRKRKKLFESRIIKEVLHEIGHLILGSEHCSKETCIMKFSNDITEVDDKPIFLCENCQKRLEKVRLKFNF